MVWIVINENPRPDTYIPVLVRPATSHDNFKNDKANYQIFDNRQEAVAFARQIKHKFMAKSIRIFYPEGNSRILK